MRSMIIRRNQIGGICRIPAMLALLAVPCAAHPHLNEFLLHEVRLAGGERYLDLEVAVTFYAEQARLEQREMDADGDGAVSAPEARAYLERIEEKALEALHLYADNEVRLPLTPHYPPRITWQDASDPDSVEHDHEHEDPQEEVADPHHMHGPTHTVHLYFFAPTPQLAEEEVHITLEHGLWTQYPALIRFSVKGSAGVQLQAEPQHRGVVAPASNTRARRLIARLIPKAAVATYTKAREGEAP